MVIDQAGLLQGERIRACSDDAQLHFPRLLVASNGLGRIEMSYKNLCARVYGSLKQKPTMDELRGWMREYHANFLLYVYQASDGSVWGQWEIPKRCLPQFARAECKRSPAPPEDGIRAFRAAYVESKRCEVAVDDYIDFSGASAPASSPSTYSSINSDKDIYSPICGIGIGIGVGKGTGIGSSVGAEPSGSLPIANLPTNRAGEYYSVSAGDVETYQRLYPAVDILQELRNMEGWSLGNAKRRKTLGGMPKFINAWLADEQNKGGRKPQGDSHAPNHGGGRGDSPAIARAKRSKQAIDGVAARFRSGAGFGSDDADAELLPASGDFAGDGGDVVPGVAGSRADLRREGAQEGAGGSHTRLAVVSPPLGAARAPGGVSEARAG